MHTPILISNATTISGFPKTFHYNFAHFKSPFPLPGKLLLASQFFALTIPTPNKAYLDPIAHTRPESLPTLHVWRWHNLSFVWDTLQLRNQSENFAKITFHFVIKNHLNGHQRRQRRRQRRQQQQGRLRQLLPAVRVLSLRDLAAAAAITAGNVQPLKSWPRSPKASPAPRTGTSLAFTLSILLIASGLFFFGAFAFSPLYCTSWNRKRTGREARRSTRLSARRPYQAQKEALN